VVACRRRSQSSSPPGRRYQSLLPEGEIVSVCQFVRVGLL
jgi:hypothetical protein